MEDLLAGIKAISLPEWGWTLGVTVLSLFLGAVLAKGVRSIARRYADHPRAKWLGYLYVYFRRAIYFFFPAVLMIPLAELLHTGLVTVPLFQSMERLLVTLFATFFALGSMRVYADVIKKRYDITGENNAKARRVRTRFEVIYRLSTAMIVLVGIGSVLLSFEELRGLGVSVLASAGVTGIVIGFSAQKVLSNLVAGIQIAFTQPISIEDAVVVEGEWGWIEEITLTYVVVKIWDRRRLVLPISYFTEKPFQNWTRGSGQILGDVYLHLDYRIPVDPLRKELDRILDSTTMWDQDAKVLQVVDMTDKVVVLRALMTAKDSPTCWDLRCYVREHLLTYIQQNYDEYLSTSRILFTKVDDDKTLTSPPMVNGSENNIPVDAPEIHETA